MKSTSVTIWVVVLCLASSQAIATTVFDGGSQTVHTVDYVIVDDVWVRGAATLNLVEGGVIDGFLHTFEYSHLNISGGRVYYDVRARDESQVIFSGGYIGGKPNGDLKAQDDSRVMIWGGCNQGAIRSGMYEGDTVITTIVGSNFAVDGQSVDYGDLTEKSGVLTGTLLSGEELGCHVGSKEFRIVGDSRIILAPIPEPPTPPVADAGSDQTVIDADDNGSEQVTLDGSGSSDSDGTIVSWVWTDDLGDTIPDSEITTATLSVGTHTITLTVTDDDGLTDTDTVTVTVESCPSFPPDANANGPYSIYVGDTLTLDASGSTDDDNDIVSYMWDLDDNNSFETDAGRQAIFDVNYTYLQSLGLLINYTYTIHLKVTDSEGQSDVADSTLTIVPKPATVVAVDIKPGSCPNPVNVKSKGVLPVAILGTEDVNVFTIDPTSIAFSFGEISVGAIRSGYEDVATPVSDSNDCNCITDGPDGFLDLTLKFETQRIVEAVGDVNDGDVRVLTLTGVLFDPMPFETPIEGADCILIRGKFKPFNRADINKDGVVDITDFAIITENWLQSSIVED